MLNNLLGKAVIRAMAIKQLAFTQKREFKWFVALVALALLLLWLQGGQKPASIAIPTPLPSPSANGYELLMPDGTTVTRSYTMLDGVYRDSATIRNNGNGTTELT